MDIEQLEDVLDYIRINCVQTEEMQRLASHIELRIAEIEECNEE